MTKEYLGKVKLASVASMTVAEKWTFLERGHEICVSTVSGGGEIFSSPLWYTVVDRRIFLPIDQASKHMENSDKGSSMTGVVFKGGDELATARGVQVRGRAKLVNDPALALECVNRVVERIFGAGHPHAETYIEYRDAFDNTTMELEPVKMISWDLRKAYNLPMYSSREF